MTPKQQRFVEEYLVDLNATQAAIRAGYSKRTAKDSGHELLQKEAVAAAIGERARRVTQGTDVTVERIVRELAAIGFHDARKLFHEDGTLKPPGEWDDDTAAAIAGVENEEIFEGFGKNRTWVGTLRKVKRWDKAKALEILARYKKLFDDAPKFNLNGAVVVYLPSNGRERG